MVCKNCGADLKPGIKYCLECGSYIDDDDEEEEVVEEEAETKEDEEVFEELPVEEELAPVQTTTKKRRRIKLSLTDYLIYAGLLLIMIVSIVVIIVVLVRDSKPVEPEPEPPIVQPAKTVDLGDYSITVPEGMDSTSSGDSITISDDTNYTFTFMLREDNFDAYQKDRTIIENQLKDANYIVHSSYEKEESGRTFLIYDFQETQDRKIFYLSKIDDKYTAMGVINRIANGKWETALPVIYKVCESIQFEDEIEK